MTWKLKHTLSRKNASFRPIETEDLKYLWLIYKTQGMAETLGPPFDKPDMAAAEFSEQMRDHIAAMYHGAWILLARDAPAGFVFAFWPHAEGRLSPFMIIGNIVWLSKIGARTKIEAAVQFFEGVRHEIPMMDYALSRDQKFFETMCKHGIMRRIGTSFNVYPGQRAAVFETRKP